MKPDINQMKEKLTGLLNPPAGWGLCSGSVLKTIAVITMLIDHFGAAVIAYVIRYRLLPAGIDLDTALNCYYLIRGIGRTAFPIYCFLLVEGFLHTKRIELYFGRLLLFAALSELPFDLAFFAKEESGSADIYRVTQLNFDEFMAHQNVFWTLLIGLSAIWLVDLLRKRMSDETDSWGLRKPVCVAGILLLTVAACLLADAMGTDYGGYGVALILVFYYLRPWRIAAVGAGYLTLIQVYSEVWAFPGFILMLAYNGQRGYIRRSGKYFFYAFYPVHLLLLYLLRCAII